MKKQQREMLTLAELYLLNRAKTATHRATLPGRRVVEIEISEALIPSLEKRGWIFERIER